MQLHGPTKPAIGFVAVGVRNHGRIGFVQNHAAGFFIEEQHGLAGLILSNFLQFNCVNSHYPGLRNIGGFQVIAGKQYI
jgi:hypothetical protein